MTRLQNEVGPKNGFRGTNLLTKSAPKFSPISLEPSLCGPEKSCKILAKFAAEFPLPKLNKVHRRASAGAQGEYFCLVCGGLRCPKRLPRFAGVATLRPLGGHCALMMARPCASKAEAQARRALLPAPA